MMKRKMTRRNFLKVAAETAAVTTATGMLSSCGITARVQDKEKIKAGVLQKDGTYSKYDNLVITSYEILSRETNKSEMTDKVCFQVIAENELFSYEATYDIVYILQEKSWTMGSFECIENQFVPLVFPTEEDAQKEVEQESRRCISLGQTDGDGWKDFVYSFQCIDQTYPSLALVSQVDVALKFVPSTDTVWKASIKNSDVVGYQFNMAGDWYYKDEEHDIHINVGESPVMMFNDTPTLTVNSYKIWFRRQEWYMTEVEEKHYESNTPVELSGAIGSPYSVWYSVDRNAFDELIWGFELDGENCRIEYDFKQKDFALNYEGNYYKTLVRE